MEKKDKWQQPTIEVVSVFETKASPEDGQDDDLAGS